MAKRNSNISVLNVTGSGFLIVIGRNSNVIESLKHLKHHWKLINADIYGKNGNVIIIMETKC